MNSFKSEGWYYLTNRGYVAKIMPPDKFEPIKCGDKVEIDGKTYTVKGLERYTMTNPEAKPPIGILVEGTPEVFVRDIVLTNLIPV